MFLLIFLTKEDPDAKHFFSPAKKSAHFQICPGCTLRPPKPQLRDLGDENARAFASLKSASGHFHGLKERPNIDSKEDQNYRLG